MSHATINWPSIFDLRDQSKRYTLTDQSYICAFFSFALILATLCVLTLAFFGVKSKGGIADQDTTHKKAMKRLSWVLSCFNSGLLTALGFAYVVFQFQESGFELQKHSLQHIDNFSALTCLWFAMFNVTDLVFGTIYYPKQMDPLTAYVHHPLFIYIMFACTTGYYGGISWPSTTSWRSIIFDRVPPFSSSFMLVCAEELPTFILALGSVYPTLRSDLGFGVSFFLLRILYHAFVMLRGIYVGVHPFQSCLYGITLFMHMFWFKGWVTSMRKNAKKKE